MDRTTREPDRAAPNPIEQQRRPDGARVPGESPGKRTNDERDEDHEREIDFSDDRDR